MSVLLHTFSWEGGGSEVFLQGSFFDWKTPGTPMIKSGDGFTVQLPVPAGRYEYKFVIDGIFRYNPKDKVTPDGFGGLNNVCEVTDCQQGVQAIAAISRNSHLTQKLGAHDTDLNSTRPNSNDVTSSDESTGSSFSPASPTYESDALLSVQSLYSFTPEDVYEHFSLNGFGMNVTNVRLCRDRQSSTGFIRQAIVSFAPLWQANDAVVELDDSLLLTNYKIFVKRLSLGQSESIISPDPRFLESPQSSRCSLEATSDILSTEKQKSSDSHHQSSSSTLREQKSSIPQPRRHSKGSPQKPSSLAYAVKVTCLAKTVSEDVLVSHFEKYGRLVGRPVVNDSKNRYAWVNFDTLEGAENAVSNLDGFCLEERNIKVSMKTNQKPALQPISSPNETPPIQPVAAKVKVPNKEKRESPSKPVEANVKAPKKEKRESPSKPVEAKVKILNKGKNSSRQPPEEMIPLCHKYQSLSTDDLLLRIKYALDNSSVQSTEMLSRLRQQKELIIIPKKCPLDLFLQLEAETKSLTHDILELENRQAEFTYSCERMYENARSFNAPGFSQVSFLEKLDKRFERECSKFEKGLPIYTHRREIVEMVRTSQVSILTAETGSGKSTQLVQYLYEEGFAETGIIVCTQPRKVAAMSLAKYVSSEMLETPGTIVGYKTGIRGNSCKQTRVMYMTDHTLLNECVHDSSFSKYSCLIIDEAHERNLNTDVLLAFIKRCLPNRPDLRVIITSATIDPESFVQYFGKQCPVKKVPGRIFPVDVVYCPPAQTQTHRGMANYVSGSIELAHTLHLNEPRGDILVFLTSPGEVEQACQALEKITGHTAVVLPLHGKLQPEDQQKVFQSYAERKIVFSTNVAETSVTIPGVKYIVDSGRAKELCFDAKKNMNSLEVRTISKSSAEQRKGRAGRTSAGKCYRLYAEDEYKSMSDRMVPEILRVALAGTVLKLHELGIKDVLSFDFIEKPDETALKFAVDTLEFLDAIADGQLTDIGKKMASLPIDPRLSKIVLDGIDEGVGLEAISTVAISSLAGTIFFRGGTNEMKERSDLLKSTFCDSLGDQLTHFNTYFQWVSCCQADRNAWCVEKSINAKSMRIVHETVKDLTEIVKKQLKVSLPLSLDKASEKLPRLYFRAFANNLCAYLGHEKIGYFNPNLPEERLVIFPGSSLCHLNLNPSLLVYEKTLKTSQHFLLQTLPVKEEWVQEAIESGKIACHPTSNEQFKKLEVTSFIVDGLGEHVLNLVVRNQRSLLEQSTTAIVKEVQFVASPEQGSLKVFVQPRFLQTLQDFIKKYVKSIREDLKTFRLEDGVTAKDDNVRVLIGSGGCITDVLMPNQYRCLVAKGPPEGTWTEELTEKLAGCGTVEKQRKVEFQREKRLYITYYDAKDAEKANKLDTPTGVSIVPQLFKKADGLTMSSLSLKIQWKRRERKNFVNINFLNVGISTSDIISMLSISGAAIGGSFIRFRQSKFENNHVFVGNIPPHLTEEAVREGFERILTPLGYAVGSYQVIFAYSAKFETSLEENQLFEEQLHSLLIPHVARDKYTMKFLTSKDFHKVYVAFVNFMNVDEGLAAMSALEHASIGRNPIRVSRSLSSTVRYSTTLYAVVEKSLKETSVRIGKEYTSVKVTDTKDKDGNVVLKITSDDTTQYVAALKKLNAVLQPQMIQCFTPMLSEYLRSKKCEEDTKRIEVLTSTVVRKDFRLKCLKIYGTETNKTKAITEFDQCHSFLHDGTKYFEVELKKVGRPPGLFKYLITTFGTDLQLLIDRKGIAMARVDIRKQLLILFATDAGHQLVLDIIDVFSTNNASNVLLTPTSTTQVDCCACYTPIEPNEDSYRLEYCGHAYHYECIEAQLAPNTIVVPIQCAADECSQSFVWQDFDNLHCKKKLDLRNVITESVRTYLAANQETVRNCPTPDCSMVYTVADDRGCFLCSHCGVITCTKCHKPLHSGLTCAMNESAANSGSEKHLEMWLQENQSMRKRCPNCAAPIEKTGGCANVTCRQCRSHICWKCLAFFPTDQDCYTHLRSNHDGNFM